MTTLDAFDNLNKELRKLRDQIFAALHLEAIVDWLIKITNRSHDNKL